MPAALTRSCWTRRSASAVLIALGLCGADRPARADVTAAECVAANEQAGPLRRGGKLREARANLRRCSAQKCPAVVRKDCVAGAAQADIDIPTIAFSVHDPGGNDLSAVKVTVDGQPFADKLDGTALEVDPGDHLFAFEAAGQPHVEKRLVIIEGEKNRRERLQMGESPSPVVVPAPVPAAPPAPLPAPDHRRSTAGLAVGGAGLGLLAVGGVSGLFALARWNDAKQACGAMFPASCANQAAAASDRSSSVAAGVVSDVTLAFGAAALVAGAVLVLSSPSGTSGSSARLVVRPDVSRGAGGIALGGAF